jgi:hypothetical protein
MLPGPSIFESCPEALAESGAKLSPAEAKDRARNSGQHDQFANNAKLQKDGLQITYKVPDAQARGGRGKAIRDAFRSCGGRAPSIPFGIM